MCLFFQLFAVLQFLSSLNYVYTLNYMKCNIPDIPQISDLECIFGVVVSNLLALAGLIFFVMLMYGGYLYMTSGGSPDATARAKNTLTHAVMGLVAAVMCYSILLIIKLMTGANVTNFSFSG